MMASRRLSPKTSFAPESVVVAVEAVRVAADAPDRREAHRRMSAQSRSGG